MFHQTCIIVVSLNFGEIGHLVGYIPELLVIMEGSKEIDFEDEESENKTDLFFAYDHPFWKEYENAKSEISTFPVLNATLTSRLDIYELNRQKSSIFYPVFIILGCIMVLGALCNILVCYVYRCRSRRATSNFFVIFFAVFDMFGCLVGIPLEVSSLALPFIYDVVPLCKIMGFVETWTVCGQCLTLICVAYDCYRKLCQPDGDFNVKKAKWCCTVALIVAMLVSIPALAVFGTRKVKTPYRDVFGTTCSLDFTIDRWLRILYNVCVLGTFTVSLCTMTVLYSLIGVGWVRQRQAEERGEKPSPAKREFPKKHRFVRQDTTTSSVTNYHSEETHRLQQSQGSLSYSNKPSFDPARVPLKGNSGIKKTNSLQANNILVNVSVTQLHVKNIRQASIFTVVSIVFVVTMLPFVVVTILRATTTVFNKFSSNTTEIVFNICIRSYLFNYLVKPVAYIAFNMNFRKEVKHMFNTLWAFCTHGSPTSGQTSSHKFRRSFASDPPRSVSRTPIYRSPRSSS